MTSVEHAWQDANNAYTASLETILEKNGCMVAKKTPTDVQKCGMMQAFYRNERALKKIDVLTGTTNIMQWPVTSSKITTFFRDDDYFAYLGSHHDAIDIASDQ